MTSPEHVLPVLTLTAFFMASPEKAVITRILVNSNGVRIVITGTSLEIRGLMGTLWYLVGASIE